MQRRKRALQSDLKTRNKESSKCRPRSLDNLLDDIRLDLRKRGICALCLCQESLFKMSDSITLDLKPVKRITLFELMDKLNLVRVCRELPSEKLCFVCVDQIKTYYEFTKNCSKISSAFKNFINSVNAECNEGKRTRKHRKVTLKLGCNDIMDYADTNAIKREENNCSMCVDAIFGEAHITVVPNDSHRCNICDCCFENHTDTMNHLKNHPNDTKLTPCGISESARNHQYKLCSVDNIPQTELTSHTKMHVYENVLRRMLKSQPFCACCLRQTVDLVNISQEVTFVGEQKPDLSLRFDTMLRELFHTEDLNRFNPVLICEDCISKAIGAYSFHQMYQQSTETLDNCLTQFEHSLNAVSKVNNVPGSKVNIRVNFEFESLASERIENYSEIFVDPHSDGNASSVQTKCGMVGRKKKSKLYECTKCKKDFTSKSKYLEHRKAHTRKEPHRCRACKLKFKSTTLLDRHKEAHKDNICCIVCRRMFSDLEIHTHMEQNHSNLKLTCNECKQFFYTKKSLTKHIVMHHTTFSQNHDANTCQLCYAQFKSHVHYIKHRCRFMCHECPDYPCVHEAFLKVFRNEERTEPKSIHKCADCDFTYTRMYTLLEHVNKEHLFLFSHTCSDCGERFPSKRALSKHVGYEHPKNTCPHCCNSFRSKILMEKHAEVCINLHKPYTCEVCDVGFVTLYQLTGHFRNHTPRALKCSLCSKTFRSREKLDTHTSKMHKAGPTQQNQPGYRPKVVKPSRLQCSMCIMEFSSSKERLEHEMTHPPDTEHICHICQKTFRTRIERYEHLRNHKPHLDKPCEICGRMFDKNTLRKHMKVHASETTAVVKAKNVRPKNLMCDICGALKVTRQALNRHKEFHRNQQKCPHCHRSISKVSFEKHVRQHESRDDSILKVYEVKGKMKRFYKNKLRCDKCDYSTVFEPCYEAHLNKHLNVKPYVCKICAKAFYSKVTHMQHVKTHEGLKPEQCQQCSKRFGSKKALTFHLRLHTGERPFVCDYCKLSFVTANRMREHQIRNHFKPQFPCDICSKMFYAERYVRKHIKEVHLGEKRGRARGKKKEQMS